ncbi:putative RNA-binding protein 23 [Armadillidium vulgare]|nr:putative RNA-binding protein 23 [Armadillidium vulgare]
MKFSDYFLFCCQISSQKDSISAIISLKSQLNQVKSYIEHNLSSKDVDRDRKEKKDKSREKDKYRSKDKERDRSREREREREKERARERELKERERERAREKERLRERERRRRSHSRRRSRSRSRERRHRTRSKSKERRRRSRERERRRTRSPSREKRRLSRSHSRERKRKRDTRSRSKEKRRSKTKSPKRELTAEERDARTVFCMQLSSRIRGRDLEDFFSVVGKISDVRIITDAKTRRSKGIAYVEFEDVESVPLALGLSGQKILGVPIIVQPTLAEKNRLANPEVTNAKGMSGPMRLYVGSLISILPKDMLRSIFEPFGKIDHIQLITDTETGRSKGYVLLQAFYK